ncbi:MAG: AsmA family protein [Sedimentisphaerales bacterium]|nr:AsmA family protein [Sedimentisphaerales bacterium]
MKILRRLFITIPLIIVILLVGAVVLVRLFADRAVKFGIEKGGSAVLPVAVKVGDADVSILGSKVALHDLVVENPQGYKHENLLELKDGSVGVNVKSLLSDTVQIRHITLDGAVVVLEQKDLLRNNIKDIIKALPKEDEGQAAPSGKKLHIDELTISNTTVKVKLLPLPGKVDTIPLKLGTIKMTDLGSDNNLGTAKLIGIVLSAIFRGIAEQGKGILPDDLVDGLSGALGKTFEIGKEVIMGGAETGKKLLEGAGDAGKKLLEGAGDAGKGIGEGLKGLLPGKKKEEE